MGLWLRTRAGAQIDFFVVVSATRSYGVGTEPGRMIGFLQQERSFYPSADADDVIFAKMGFRYLRITSAGMRRWNLVLPLWFIAAIAALLPSLWWNRRRMSRKSIRLGLCLSCGYDLRATPDRCPECGTVRNKVKP